MGSDFALDYTRNVVEDLIGTRPEISEGLKGDAPLTEEAIEPLFQLVEHNGARLHEVVDLGKFLALNSRKMPPQAAFRFAHTAHQARDAQRLYPHHGLAPDVSQRDFIRWGFRPYAFAKALSRVEQREFKGDKEAMATRINRTPDMLKALEIGEVLPGNWKQVAQYGMALNVSPHLLGLTLLSDLVGRTSGRNPEMPIHSHAERMANTLIISTGIVLAPVDIVDILDNLPRAAIYAGFSPSLVRRTLAGFALYEKPDVTLKEAKDDAAGYLARGRSDEAFDDCAFSAAYFEKKGDHAAAIEMLKEQLATVGGLKTTNPVTRGVIDSATTFITSEIGRLSGVPPFMPSVGAASIRGIPQMMI